MMIILQQEYLQIKMLAKINQSVGSCHMEQYHQTDKNMGTKKVFSFQKVLKDDGMSWRRQISWKMEEKIKYIAYVYYQFDSFEETGSNRFWNFFNQMANFIKTKNSNQCRIYHKRIIKKYKSVKYLLSVIQQSVPDLSWILSVYTDQLLQNQIEGSKKMKLENEDEKLNKNYLIAYDNFNGSIIPSKQMDIIRNIYRFESSSQKNGKIDNLQEKQISYLSTDVSLKQKNYQNQKQRSSFKSHNFQIETLFSYPKRSSQFKPYKQSNNLPNIQIKQINFDQKNSQTYRKWVEFHQLYLNWTSKRKELQGFQS